MKAMMYTGIEELELRELPDPSGEFAIRVLGCAICGTDLKTYLRGHPHFKPPMILGHEFIGRVLRAPDGSGFSPGDNVAVAPYGNCGVCAPCARGAGEMCKNKGYVSTGAFCEQVEVTPEYARRALIKLDSPDFAYALTEPLACVLCAFEMLETAGGSRALIIGGGPMGALFAETFRCKGLNADISEPNPLRAASLREWGYGVRAPEDVKYGDYDNIIVAVNKPELVAEAVRGVADCGAVHIFSGMPGDSVIGTDAYSIHYRKVRLLGSTGFALCNFRDAHAAISSAPERFRRMITHKFALEDTARAFKLLSEGNAFKVMVTP